MVVFERYLKQIIGIAAFLLFPLVLSAQITWDGGAGTNLWSDGLNWSTDAVPGDADDVEINGNYTVSVTSSDSCRSLQLISENNNTRAVNLIISNGSRLGIGTDLTMNDRDRTNSSCNVDVQGGATLYVAGDLYMTKDNGTSSNNDMLLRIADDNSRVRVGDDLIADFSGNNNSGNEMGIFLTENSALEVNDINITLGSSQEFNELLSINASGTAGDSAYVTVTNDFIVVNNGGSMDFVIDMDYEGTLDVGNNFTYSATAGEGFYWYVDRDAIVNIGNDLTITKGSNEEIYLYLNQNNEGTADDAQMTVGGQMTVTKTDGDDFFTRLSGHADLAVAGSMTYSSSNEDDNGDDQQILLEDDATITVGGDLSMSVNDGSEVDILVRLSNNSSISLTGGFNVNMTNAHFFELELNDATSFSVGTDFNFSNTTSSNIPIVDLQGTASLTVGDDLIWTDNNTVSDNGAGFFLDEDASIAVTDTFLIDKNTDGHLFIYLNQAADGSANDARITASNFLVDVTNSDDVYCYLSNDADIITTGNIEFQAINQDGNGDDLRILLNDQARLQAGNRLLMTLSDGNQVDGFIQLNDASSIAVTNDWTINQTDATLFEIETNGSSAITVGTDFVFTNSTASSYPIVDMHGTSSFTVGEDLLWTDNTTDNDGTAGFYLDGDASIAVTDTFLIDKNTDGHLFIYLNQATNGSANDARITASNFLVDVTNSDDIYCYLSDGADIITTGNIEFQAINQDGDNDDLRILLSNQSGLQAGDDLLITFNDNNQVDCLVRLNDTSSITVADQLTITQTNAHFFEWEMNSASTLTVGDDFRLTNTTTSNVPILDMQETASIAIGGDFFWTDNNTEGDNGAGLFLDGDAAMAVTDTFLIDKNTDGHLFIYLNQAADGSANDARITASNFLVEQTGGDDLYCFLSNDADIIATGNIQFEGINQDSDGDDIQIIVSDDASLQAGDDFLVSYGDDNQTDLLIRLNNNAAITVADQLTVSQNDGALFEIELNNASNVTVGTDFTFTNTTTSSIAWIDMDGTATLNIGEDLLWTDNHTDNGGGSGFYLDSDAALSVTDSIRAIKNTDGNFYIYLNQTTDGSANDAQVTAATITVSADGIDDVFCYLSNDADITTTGDFFIQSINQDGDGDDIQVLLNDDAGITVGNDFQITYNDANTNDLLVRLNTNGSISVANDFIVSQTDAHFFELELNNASTFSTGNDFVFQNTSTSNIPVMDMQGTSTLTVGGDLLFTDDNSTNDSDAGFFLDEDASITVTDSLYVVRGTNGRFRFNLNQAADGSAADAQLTTSYLVVDQDNTDFFRFYLANDADITVANNFLVTSDNHDQNEFVDFRLADESGIDVNGNMDIIVNSVNSNVDLDFDLTSSGSLDVAGNLNLTSSGDDIDLILTNSHSMIVGGNWTNSLSTADNFDLDIQNSASIAVGGDMTVTNATDCGRIYIDMDSTSTVTIGQDLVINNNSTDGGDGETRITLDNDAALTIADSLHIVDTDDDQTLIQLNQNQDGAAADAQIAASYFVLEKNQGDEIQIYLSDDADLTITNDFLLDVDDLDLDNNITIRLFDDAGVNIGGNMTMDVDNQPVDLDLDIDMTSSDSLVVGGNVVINLTGDNVDIDLGNAHVWQVGGDYTATLTSADNYDFTLASSSSLRVAGDYTVSVDGTSQRIRHTAAGTGSFVFEDDFFLINASTSAGNGESQIELDEDATFTVTDSLYIRQQQSDQVNFLLNQNTDGAAADAQLSTNYLVVDKDNGTELQILLANDADITVTNNLLLDVDQQGTDLPVRFTLNDASGIDVNGSATIDISSTNDVDFDFNHNSTGDFDVAQDLYIITDSDDLLADLTSSGDLIVGDTLSISANGADNLTFNIGGSSEISVGKDWINSFLNSDNFQLFTTSSATIAVADRFQYTDNAASDLFAIDMDNTSSFTANDLIVFHNSATTVINNGIFMDRDASMTIADSIYFVNPTEGNVLFYLNQTTDGSAADAQLTANSITIDKDQGDLLSVRVSDDADITVATNFTIDGDNFENGDHAEIRLADAAGIDINGSLLFSNNSTLDNDVRLYHSSSANLDVAQNVVLEGGGDDLDIDMTGTGEFLIGGNLTMTLTNGDNIDILSDNDTRLQVGGDWNSTMTGSDFFNFDLGGTGSVVIADRFNLVMDGNSDYAQLDMDSAATFTAVDFYVNNAADVNEDNGIFMDRDAAMTISDSITWIQSRNGNLRIDMNRSAAVGSGSNAQLQASAILLDKDSGDYVRIATGQDANIAVTNNVVIQANDLNGGAYAEFLLDGQGEVDVSGDVLITVNSSNSVDIDIDHSSSGNFDVAGNLNATITNGDDFDVTLNGTGDLIVGGELNGLLTKGDQIAFELSNTSGVDVTGDVNLINTANDSRRVRINMTNTATFAAGEDLIFVVNGNGTSDAESQILLNQDASLTIADSLFITHAGGDEVQIDLNQSSTGSAADAQLTMGYFVVDKDSGTDLRIRLLDGSDMTVANDVLFDFNQAIGGEDILINMGDNSGIDINGNFSATINSLGNASDVRLVSTSTGDLDVAGNATTTVNTANNIDFDFTGTGGFIVGGNFVGTIPSGEDFNLDMSSSATWTVGGDLSVTMGDADIMTFNLLNSASIDVTGDVNLRNTNTNCRRILIDMDNTSSYMVGQDMIIYNETSDNNSSETELILDGDAVISVTDSLFITHVGNDDVNLRLNTNSTGSAADAQINAGNIVMDVSGGDNFTVRLDDDADLNVTEDLVLIYGTSEGTNDQFQVVLNDNAGVNVDGSATLTYNNGFSSGVQDFVLDLNSTSSLNVGPSGGPFNTESLTIEMLAGNDVNIRMDGSSQINVFGDFNWRKTAGDDFELDMNLVDGTNTEINIAGDFDIDNPLTTDLITIEMDESALLDVDGDFDLLGIAETAKFTLQLDNTSKLELAGNFLQNAAPNNFGRLVMNNSSVLEFNGSTVQQLMPADVGGGSDFFDYENVIFNNTLGTVPQLLAGGDATVRGNLTFTDGILYSSNDSLLILADEATVSDMSDVSHVNGPVRKVGNDAFTFPVGNGEQYRLCGISAPGATSDIFTATYFDENPWPLFDGGFREVSIDHISTREYWDISRDNGSSAVQITLSWDTNSGGVDALGELLVAHWDGSEWINEGNLITTGSATTGTVQSVNAVNSFSPFTLASNTTNNPLPIELLRFDAYKWGSDQAQIAWTTATEINNDYFEVERSADGTQFETIGIVDGAGNSTRQLDYLLNDEAPLTGWNYYRLRQTDFDGTNTTTEIKGVYFESSDLEGAISIWPNPVTENQFRVIVPEAYGETIQVELHDLLGRPVSMELRPVEGGFEARIKDRVAGGTYLLSVLRGNERSVQQVFVR